MRLHWSLRIVVALGAVVAVAAVVILVAVALLVDVVAGGVVVVAAPMGALAVGVRWQWTLEVGGSGDTGLGCRWGRGCLVWGWY